MQSGSPAEEQEWRLVLGEKTVAPTIEQYIEAGRIGRLPPLRRRPEWYVFRAPNLKPPLTVDLVRKSVLTTERRRTQRATELLRLALPLVEEAICTGVEGIDPDDTPARIKALLAEEPYMDIACR